MSQNKINISLTPKRNLDEFFYLRMELEEEADDFATLEDAANLIDNLFQTSICNEDFEIPVCGGSLPSSSRSIFSSEQFAEVVQESLDIAACEENSATYNVKVRAILSHPELPVTFRVDVLEDVTQNIVLREITRRYNVSGLTEIELDYPIIGQRLELSWEGPVITAAGSTEPPELRAENGIVFWDSVSSGVIKATFVTQYIVLDLNIPRENSTQTMDGVIELPQAIEGGVVQKVFNGEATILAFYHFEVTEFEVTEPELQQGVSTLSEICPGDVPTSSTSVIEEEEPYCFDLVTETIRCQCSGEVAVIDGVTQSVEVEVERTCPDNASGRTLLRRRRRTVSFIDCNETTGRVSDPDFYESRCCTPPEVTLPRCEETMTANIGGFIPSPEEVQRYTEEYTNVEFVPISPLDGDCGVLTTRQITTGLTCCDAVDPIVVDDDRTVEIIADNSAGNVFFDGGLPPFRVSISGENFFISDASKPATGLKSAFVLGQSFTIRTLDACGTCNISISDSCGNSASTSVRSVNGRYEDSGLTYTWENSPCKYIFDNQQTVISDPETIIAGGLDNIQFNASTGVISFDFIGSNIQGFSRYDSTDTTPSFESFFWNGGSYVRVSVQPPDREPTRRRYTLAGIEEVENLANHPLASTVLRTTCEEDQTWVC